MSHLLGSGSSMNMRRNVGHCDGVDRACVASMRQRTPRLQRCRQIRVLCDTRASRSGDGRSPSSGVVSEKDSVTVTFRWPGALNNRQVSVTGTFSNWQPVQLYSADADGDFFRSIKVPIGEHEYKFLADCQWKVYPSDPVTVDASGNCNNYLTAYPTVRFVWDGALGGETVYVSGSFNQWKELIPLQQDVQDGGFSVDCCLPPGEYNYLFLVDGEWRILPSEPHKTDADGRHCNQISVVPYDAYRIYYATGWERPTLRARLTSSTNSTDWRELTLCDTRSRASFFGVNWKVATAVAATFGDIPKSAALEFYIVNEDGAEDRPSVGAYYRCPVIGGYKLQDGILKPFSKSAQGPVMLVSDLDGTMVSSDAESDDAMQDFTFYWENNASLYNSVLIYNTGRSLGQFMHLLQEKDGALSLPDVVITAVGTKIFHLSTRGRGRSRASGLDWIEDVTWSNFLDKGWDLQAVRQAGDAMIHALSPSRVNWLDKGEEHPHRVAFSIRIDAMDNAQQFLKTRLQECNLQVRLIVSGTGGWRYLDCVPFNGGKLEALEYVRRFFNIPIPRCVAAGDSCNDILMLQGKNPAIVVGNAQEELCQWLLSQPQTNRVIFTDAYHGRGIIEGLSRLGLY